LRTHENLNNDANPLDLIEIVKKSTTFSLWSLRLCVVVVLVAAKTGDIKISAAGEFWELFYTSIMCVTFTFN